MASIAAVVAGSTVRDAGACFAAPPAPQTLVAQAEVILRVRAEAMVNGPAASSPIDVIAREQVRFLVLDTLKGEQQGLLVVQGRLVDRPDFNTVPVPYSVVRRDGLGGSCFASTYQKGGEYLLFLKTVRGTLTPYWAPLGPTTEQIHGAEDPWLEWVRSELARTTKHVSGRQGAGR